MPEQDEFFKPDTDFIPDEGPEQNIPDEGPEQPGMIDSAKNYLHSLAAEHPVARELIQRALTGTSPEFEAIAKSKGIDNVQGPGLMEIPGVTNITNKIEHAIDPTDSPFYTGLRPLAAGAAKLVGDTLASGFDPRTAGVKTPNFKLNKLEQAALDDRINAIAAEDSPKKFYKPVKGLLPERSQAIDFIADERGNVLPNQPTAGPLGETVSPDVAISAAAKPEVPKLKLKLTTDGKLIPAEPVQTGFTEPDLLTAAKPPDYVEPPLPGREPIIAQPVTSETPKSVEIPKGTGKLTLKNPDPADIAGLKSQGYVVTNQTSKSVTLTNSPKTVQAAKALEVSDFTDKPSLSTKATEILKNFINETSGEFNPGKLVENVKKLLRLKGKTADEVSTIREGIISGITQEGRLDIPRVFNSVSSTISRTQFDKILNDIIESGDLTKLAAERRAKNLARDTAPMQMRPTELTEPQAVLSQLLDAVKAHGKARIEQDQLLSAERKQRVVNAMKVNEPGMQGFFNQLRELKGEYPKVQAEIKSQIFSPQAIDQLKNTIEATSGLDFWDKVGATNALGKVTGVRPMKGALQPSEIQDLQKIFGAQLTDDLVELHGGIGFVGSPTWDKFVRAGSTAKALVASTDLGGFFRAGRNYAFQKEWRDSIIPSIKAYFSEGQYNNVIEQLKHDPVINDAREHGLAITDYHGSNPLSREELFQSLDAEKIPILKYGVKASNRSQTVMNDTIRAAKYKAYLDKYSNLYDSLKKTARTPEELKTAEEFNPNSDKLKEMISQRINVATGRGSLGRLEKIAPELNAFGFSPRFLASRVQTIKHLLSPEVYVGLDKVERTEAVKQLLSLSAVSAGFLGSSALLGGKVGLNPLSTDFMKAKFGNKHYDPNGGYQQLIVPVARILAGGSVSGSGKASVFGDYGASDAKDILANFATSKEAPIPALALTIMNRHDAVGRPLNRSLNPLENTATRATAISMIIQDMYDAFKDDPTLLNQLAVVPLDSIGIGVQTYSPDDDKDLKIDDKAERDVKRKKLQAFADSFK